MGREELLGAAVAVVGVAVVAVGGYTLAHPDRASSDAAPVAAQSGAARPPTTAPPTTRSAQPPPTGSASAPGSTPPAPVSTAQPPTTSVLAQPSAPATTGGSFSPDAKAPLVVLNNTRTAGLAGKAAQEFRDAGWSVTSVGNLRNDILSSCAYYDPTQSGAQDAAAALKAQFPGLRRTAPKFSGLPSGPVVVVLTPDWN